MADMNKRYRSPDDTNDPFYTDGTVDYDRVQGNNPLAGGEYPKAMYRAGGHTELHGHMVDVATVTSEAEEEAYATEGWRTTPTKAATYGRTLVEEKKAEPDPRDEELRKLRAEIESLRAAEPESFAGYPTPDNVPMGSIEVRGQTAATEMDDLPVSTRPRRGRPPNNALASTSEAA